MEEKKATVGILLAGGLSRRYGSPKAFAKMNEKYFYEIVYDVLAATCDDVIIVTRAELIDRFPKKYHVIVDEKPFVGCGPLAGIYSAMKEVQAKNYVVLPCDMPLINVEVMRQLLRLHEKDITVVTSEKYIQPLVSVWNERVKNNIKNTLLKGKFKMTAVLDVSETVQIDGRHLSNSPHVFMNVNTIEHDKEMRKWLK